MTGLAPLFLLWLLAPRSSSNAAPSMPSWPTPASPPPPMPAFQPQAQPTNAETSTPLPELHTSPETPAPANAIEPAQAKAKAKSKKAKPKAAAAAKAKSAAAKAGQQVATVLSLQTILNSRGAKLKRDGLYGPKTASAWSVAAKKKGLPAAIVKVGPTGQLARVASRTFDALKTPPIP